MLNQRLAGAQKIFGHLIGTEDSIDTAVTRSAELVACMTIVRKEANLGAQVGHEALERAVAALTKMIEARREMVAAHQELEVVQGQLGLSTRAFGGLHNKGPANAQGLSVVDQAA